MNHCFNNRITQPFAQTGRGCSRTRSVEIKSDRFKIDFLEEEAKITNAIRVAVIAEQIMHFQPLACIIFHFPIAQTKHGEHNGTVYMYLAEKSVIFA